MYYISISMYIILYILFPPFCNAHINIQEQIFIYPIWNQVSHETWPMGGGGSGSVHTQLRLGAWAVRTWPRTSAADDPSVSKSVFTITEKAPTRAFPWLNAPKSIFTFKTLLRHYAKRVFTAHLVDVKLDTQHNYHKGLQLYDTPACLKTSLPFSPVT